MPRIGILTTLFRTKVKRIIADFKLLVSISGIKSRKIVLHVPRFGRKTPVLQKLVQRMII